MKHFLLLLLLSSLLSCSDKSRENVDPAYEYEINERSLILKNLFDDPEPYTVEFYKADRNTTSPRLIIRCLNTEVEMRKPYAMAKDSSFHVYYWRGYTFDRDNDLMKIYFSPESK